MKTLLIWAVLARAGDLTTTGINLHNGCHELNQMLAQMNFPTIAALHGGSTVAFLVVVPQLRKTHPKSTKTLTIVAASAATAGMMWNMAQLARGTCRRGS